MLLKNYLSVIAKSISIHSQCGMEIKLTLSTFSLNRETINAVQRFTYSNQNLENLMSKHFENLMGK